VTAAIRAQASRVHQRPARRLRHARRRARPVAFGRPAPADRDRRVPLPDGPTGADPGRRHRVGGREYRGQDQAGAARGDAGPHHADHRGHRPVPPSRWPRRVVVLDPRPASSPRASTPPCSSRAPVYQEIYKPRAWSSARFVQLDPRRGRRSRRRTWHEAGLVRWPHQPPAAPRRAAWGSTATARRVGAAGALHETPTRPRAPDRDRSACWASPCDHHRRPADGQAGDRPRHQRPATSGRWSYGVAAYLAVAALGWVFGVVQSYLTTWVGERVLTDLRSDLFRPRAVAGARVLRAQPAPGVVISRLTNDIEALNTLVTDGPTHARAELDHAGGLGGGAADPGLEAGRWATLIVFPAMSIGTAIYRPLLGDRLPADARAAGRGHRQPCRRTSRGVRVVQAFPARGLELPQLHRG